MAATLIYLKSKLLLPAPDVDEEPLDPEGEALRLELEARLRAYARVKEIGEWLRAQEAEWGTRFVRTWSELPMPEYLPVESLSLWDLSEAYRGFLERLARGEPTRDVEPEPPSLLARMAEIVGVLDHSWYVLFSALLGASPPRPEVVVTLLAVLELVRLAAGPRPAARAVRRHRDRTPPDRRRDAAGANGANVEGRSPA